MKFSKHDLAEETHETVVNEITDHDRWTAHYRRVFKVGDKYFETHYRVGATEYQDEGPYEYDPDEIECEEVFPTQVTVVQYLRRS
jgi:hypothetical protein